MKQPLFAVAFVAASAALSPTVQAAPDVGVSVGIYPPGVYGRIDIGSAPPPPVVYPQPIIVAPAPVVVQRRPIYLYVPPGHQKNWRKHCARYNACNQPVYFVQERWVEDRWRSGHERAAPRTGFGHGAREFHGGRDEGQGRAGPGHGPERGRPHGRPEGHDRGHGHGHGRDR